MKKQQCMACEGVKMVSHTCDMETQSGFLRVGGSILMIIGLLVLGYAIGNYKSNEAVKSAMTTEYARGYYEANLSESELDGYRMDGFREATDYFVKCDGVVLPGWTLSTSPICADGIDY